MITNKPKLAWTFYKYLQFLFIYDNLGDDKPREDKELGHEVPCIAKASFLVN